MFFQFWWWCNKLCFWFWSSSTSFPLLVQHQTWIRFRRRWAFIRSRPLFPFRNDALLSSSESDEIIWLCVMCSESFSWAVHAERAHQWMTRTETTLDQDWGFENESARLYIVYCRSFLPTSVTLNTSPLEDCTLWCKIYELNHGWRIHKNERSHIFKLILVKKTQIYKHNLLLQKGLFSFQLSSPWQRSVSVHKNSRCILSLRRTLSLLCPFTGFAQLVHPSRCSPSTLISLFHFLWDLCVHIGFATLWPDPS